jgi:hypothetical protein
MPEQLEHHRDHGWRRLTSPSGLAMLSLLAAGFLLLVVDHWAHVFGILPYLLLIACPLMHLFGHGHHRHSRHDHGAKPPDEAGGAQ